MSNNPKSVKKGVKSKKLTNIEKKCDILKS